MSIQFSLTAIEAQDLLAGDLNGLSDPYFLIPQQQRGVVDLPKKKNRTKTIMKNLNPVWNETFQMQFDPLVCNNLRIEVYDYDYIGKDDFLGAADIPLDWMASKDSFEKWYPLKVQTKDKKTKLPIIKSKGTVHLKLQVTNRGVQGAIPQPGIQAPIGQPPMAHPPVQPVVAQPPIQPPIGVPPVQQPPIGVPPIQQPSVSQPLVKLKPIGQSPHMAVPPTMQPPPKYPPPNAQPPMVQPPPQYPPPNTKPPIVPPPPQYPPPSAQPPIVSPSPQYPPPSTNTKPPSAKPNKSTNKDPEIKHVSTTTKSNKFSKLLEKFEKPKESSVAPPKLKAKPVQKSTVQPNPAPAQKSAIIPNTNVKPAQNSAVQPQSAGITFQNSIYQPNANVPPVHPPMVQPNPAAIPTQNSMYPPHAPQPYAQPPVPVVPQQYSQPPVYPHGMAPRPMTAPVTAAPMMSTPPMVPPHMAVPPVMPVPMVAPHMAVPPMPPMIPPGITIAANHRRGDDLLPGTWIPVVEPIVMVGLGWDFTGGQTFDLDASITGFDIRLNVVEAIYFKNKRGLMGSVLHYGDNLTGVGEGDDEVIQVNLHQVPRNVQYLAVTINSFKKNSLAKARSAFIRLFTRTYHIGKYILRRTKDCIGLLLGVFERSPDPFCWYFRVMADPLHGNVVTQSFAGIKTLLGSYSIYNRTQRRIVHPLPGEPIIQFNKWIKLPNRFLYIGLGWNIQQGHNYDLDASILTFDRMDTPLEIIYHKNLRSFNGSI